MAGDGRLLSRGVRAVAAGLVLCMVTSLCTFAGSCEDIRFPGQVRVAPAGDEERAEVERYTAEFCKRFGLDESRVLDAPFTVVTPDRKIRISKCTLQTDRKRGRI